MGEVAKYERAGKRREGKQKKLKERDDCAYPVIRTREIECKLTTL
jgi:hypothetical protein